MNSFNKTILIAITFLIYSGSAVFSKFTSMQEFMSINYILFLGAVVAALGIYAILWQKVLTIMPLSRAFLYKSTTIIITLFICHFLFDESISINNIIGAGIIIGGIVLLSWKKVTQYT